MVVYVQDTFIIYIINIVGCIFTFKKISRNPELLYRMKSKALVRYMLNPTPLVNVHYC